MKEEIVVSSGLGLGELTFVVLLILKITGNIGMSWFLVLTSWLWAPIIVTLVFVVIIFGGIFLAGLFS